MGDLMRGAMTKALINPQVWSMTISTTLILTTDKFLNKGGWRTTGRINTASLEGLHIIGSSKDRRRKFVPRFDGATQKRVTKLRRSYAERVNVKCLDVPLLIGPLPFKKSRRSIATTNKARPEICITFNCCLFVHLLSVYRDT